MKREIAVLFLPLLLLMVAGGCSNKVDYTVEPQFERSVVETIAVMPVGGDRGSEEGRLLFREVANETLARSGYAVLPAEVVDKRLSSLTKGREGATDGVSREEMIKALDVDTVLFITITKWETPLLLYYASIKIEAEFELYSRQGEKMWTAEYSLGDSDFSADSDYLKVAVHGAYELMVVNLVDRVLATLPLRHRASTKGKGHFDWLP
ncbi:MAG: GNA1162 family protein [Thermodesulfobacteriota bacterium]